MELNTLEWKITRFTGNVCGRMASENVNLRFWDKKDVGTRV
jgi:hypothetical protein